MIEYRNRNDRNLMIFDLFCDASVGPDLRGACAGCTCEPRQIGSLETNQPVRNMEAVVPTAISYLIQPEGTNNSGESLAVAMAVNQALVQYGIMANNYPHIHCHFNVFSDSLITINGVREWLPGWVANSVGIALRNGRGDLVKNQEYFKFIYNSILRAPENFSISFYHQDGHVKKYDKVAEPFQRRNGVSLEEIGITPEAICLANDFVDTHTRGYINSFLNDPDKAKYYNIHDIAANSYMERGIISTDPMVIDVYRHRVQRQVILI